MNDRKPRALDQVMATIPIIASVSTSNYLQRRWEKHESEPFSRIIFARTSIYYCMDASYLIHDFSGHKSSKAVGIRSPRAQFWGAIFTWCVCKSSPRMCGRLLGEVLHRLSGMALPAPRR